MKMRIDRMNKIKAVAKGLDLFLRYASKAAKPGAIPSLAEKGKNMNMLYEAFPGGGHVVILGARASIASTI